MQDLVGDIAFHIFKKAFVKKASALLKAMKKQLTIEPEEQLEKDIKEFQGWLDRQKEALKDEAITLGVMKGSYLPVGTYRIWSWVGKLPKAAKFVFAWLYPIALAVMSGYTWYQTRKAEKKMKDWIQRVQDIDLEKLKKLKSESEKDPAKKGPVDILLEKRQKAYEARREKAKEDLDKYLQSEEFKKLDLKDMKEELKMKKGIEIPKDIITIEDLNNELKEDKYITEYLDYKDAVAIRTRKKLKKQVANKLKVRKSFLSFKGTKAKTEFAGAVICAVLVGIFKTLALTGTITAAIGGLALSLTGVGFAVLTFGVLVAGLIYFYKKKPNVFKEFFKGVQLRLALKEIPYAIQNFRLSLKTMKLAGQTYKAAGLSAQRQQILGLIKADEKIKPSKVDKSLRPLLKKLKLKTEFDKKAFESRLGKYEKKKVETAKKLKKEIETLGRKVKSWEKKLKPLQERLQKARWKDYLRTVKRADKKGRKDLMDEIVDGVVTGEDEETLEIMRDYMGIKIKNFNAAEVKKLLLEYFGKSDAQMNIFIKQQLAKGAS